MKASDGVYRTLLSEIIHGDIAPGQVLAEVEQATRLGVSRTPIREALSRLSSEGFVAHSERRGLSVTALTVADVAGLYEVRQALEQQAARSAAKNRNPDVFTALARRFATAPEMIRRGDEGVEAYYRLNEELDDAVDSAIHNRYLLSALHTIRLHSARVRRIAQHDEARLVESASETLSICEAISWGDADLAASTTHVHLTHSLFHVVKTLASRDGHRFDTPPPTVPIH